MSWGRLVLLGATIAAVAPAHDLAVESRWSDSVLILEASYGGAEPAVGADVEVRGPDAEQIFQRGSTDSRGRFATLPDTEGEWRVVIDDGFGHRIETAILVDADHPRESSPTAASGRALKTLSGGALILSLGGVWYWVATRRSRAGGAP